jgi:hypothetical protein
MLPSVCTDTSSAIAYSLYRPIIDFDVPAVTISHESRVQVIHDAWINLSMSNIGVYGSVSNGELFVDISYSSVADWLIKGRQSQSIRYLSL